MSDTTARVVDYGTFTTMQEIRAANAAHGHKWFTPDTFAFFGTVVEAGPIGGCLFITSEKPPRGPRAYSVRVAYDTGEVETVGDFLAYATKAEAGRAARAHLAEVGLPVNPPIG